MSSFPNNEDRDGYYHLGRRGIELPREWKVQRVDDETILAVGDPALKDAPKTWYDREAHYHLFSSRQIDLVSHTMAMPRSIFQPILGLYVLSIKHETAYVFIDKAGYMLYPDAQGTSVCLERLGFADQSQLVDGMVRTYARDRGLWVTKGLDAYLVYHPLDTGSEKERIAGFLEENSTLALDGTPAFVGRHERGGAAFVDGEGIAGGLPDALYPEQTMITVGGLRMYPAVPAGTVVFRNGAVFSV